MYRAVFILLFLLAFTGRCLAQVCIDPIRVNPYYPCPSFYQPVCGCDGKTYRNDCAAFNQGGNNYNQYEGPCGNFDFDFYPNPARDNVNFAIVFRDLNNAVVYVYDMWGKLQFQRSVYNVNRADFILDVSAFEYGVYAIVVQCGSEIKQAKLVKGY